MIPPLSRELTGALREIARVRRLLVALDFDGTLAPHVDAPDRARALPAAREAVLQLLALPRTRVAVVSGRALDSLIAVADLPEDALLVGSHGLELRLDGPSDGVVLSPDERERRDTLHEMLSGVARSHDEVWLEEKPAGYVLHTRLAAEEDARRAHLEALGEAETLAGLTVKPGKDVLEFSVRSSSKGQALEHLRRYTRADAVFYAGDDVTDEDAFEALEASDVGVKSGGGPTSAAFRVHGPEEVAVALSALASFRSGDVHEQ